MKNLETYIGMTYDQFKLNSNKITSIMNSKFSTAFTMYLNDYNRLSKVRRECIDFFIKRNKKPIGSFANLMLDFLEKYEKKHNSFCNKEFYTKSYTKSKTDGDADKSDTVSEEESDTVSEEESDKETCDYIPIGLHGSISTKIVREKCTKNKTYCKDCKVNIPYVKDKDRYVTCPICRQDLYVGTEKTYKHGKHKRTKNA